MTIENTSLEFPEVLRIKTLDTKIVIRSPMGSTDGPGAE